MAPILYPPSLLSADQVLQHAYDDATQTIRTTATAVIVGGDLVVDIDGVYSLLSNPTPDNIGLIASTRAASPGHSTQTNRLTSITNSTVHALDVSIHNSDGSAIDATAPLYVLTGSNAATPTIYNVSAAVAGTEYSQALPIGTKKFTAKIRNATAIMQFSYAAGTTGTNFVKVNRGTFYEETGLNTTSVITFYFQTDQAAQTLELIAWV